jgi:alpha-beta hydrolase superfamily lysophospholipase
MDAISLGALAVWKHPAASAPKGRILLIHGLGEHSARHLTTITALMAAGYEVVRFDLRGCGQSGGERQWIDRFDDYVEDASQVHNWIRRELPRLPLIVLGHSMGGTIALNFVPRYQQEVDALILSAPAHLIGEAASKIKIAVGRVLARLTPHLRLPKSLTSDSISRDPKVVRDYDNDPLSCHFNTLRQGSEILDAFERVPEEAKKIQKPVLLAHGSADRLVLLQGSFDLMNEMPSVDKTLHILPGGYHEPHNDLDRVHYFSLLTLWLDSQIEKLKLNVDGTAQKRKSKIISASRPTATTKFR